jgi:hypothetical protein
LRSDQPSRIHTVPFGIFGVTCARARIVPRSLARTIQAPSAIWRAAASSGEIQSAGSGSAFASDGSARPWS